jgi:glucuronosyltransferase
LWEIENKADLLLINSYQALGNVRATVPTTIYLGGIHQATPKSLPNNLQVFVAQSSNPLVYVNVDTSICINSYRLTKLLNAIEFLDIDVIWKWNGGNMVNSSARIYQLTDDVSEDDILGKFVY